MTKLSASARARASLKRRTDCTAHLPAQAAPFAAIVLKVSHVRRSRHGLCYSPKVRRVARSVTNHARPSLARALPRRHSGLARLRSPLWLRSLPAGLLANARPPLPATAAKQLPRLASRVAALRASARNVRRPAACAFSVRRVSALARAASGYGYAFASLSPPREALPLHFAHPSRAAASRVCRHRATPAALPAARLRRGKARVAREAYRARALSGAPSRSPASGGNMLRASLARWRGFTVATELHARGKTTNRACYAGAMHGGKALRIGSMKSSGTLYPCGFPLLSSGVLGAGLEPARLAPYAPQTYVSANSTTRAFFWE